jgi:UDP-N-acetylglucosamine 2-epimerase (non-hydrolysing)
MKHNLIFFLGTKAQFIKTIPLINAVDTRLFNISIYDTWQHRNITKFQFESIEKEINYVGISNNQVSAKSIPELVWWFFKTACNLVQKKFLYASSGKSICFIHGNTLSTLLGIIWAKRNKILIVHIEGGYRSGNWFRPFPEEIIRYISSKLSDYIICFDEVSKQNLVDMRVKGEIIQVSRNTIYDAVKKESKISDVSKVSSKLTITLHRNENIFNKKRLNETVHFIIYLKNNFFTSVNWYLHPHTKKQLKKTGLQKILTENKIATLDLLAHHEFINEIKTSECILTDGESVIEECNILGVPTYALINKLENSNSNGLNIFVSKYKHTENLDFFKNISTYKQNSILNSKISPSVEILNHIQKILE